MRREDDFGTLPCNPDGHDAADRAKHAFAMGRCVWRDCNTEALAVLASPRGVIYHINPVAAPTETTHGEDAP